MWNFSSARETYWLGIFFFGWGEYVFGIFVGVGVDCDCGDAEFFCGFDDAACDLAAVGD
jgi:hypothetical protein